MLHDPSVSTPTLQRIKEDILICVRNGEWQEGGVIPGGTTLAQTFGVPRMTVNRALRELTAERILTRVQGLGTLVARQEYQATLMTIHNTTEEIAVRGRRHRAELHKLKRAHANKVMVASFGMPAGYVLSHSLIVHFENDLLIQVGDRWVSAALAPEHMEQGFIQTTSSTCLIRAASLQGVDYGIEARLPPREITEMLYTDMREPCLMLWRKTPSQGRVALVAIMWHPGGRYQSTDSSRIAVSYDSSRTPCALRWRV